MGLTAELRKWYIKTIPGMNNKVEDLDLRDKWVDTAQNCRFEDEPGAVDKRDPVAHLNGTVIDSEPIVGLYRFYTSGGLATWVAVCGTAAYSVSDAGTATQIRGSLTDGKRCSFVTYRDLLICSNGYDNPWVWDGASTNTTWELGACKAASSTAAGSMDASALYYYAVTIGTADEYVCGAVSNTISTGTSGCATLSNIPLGPAGTGARKIYRTEGGGSSLKLLDTISNNTTTTYTDTKADATLGAAYPAVTDDIRKGALLTMHRERLFISGDPSYPNKIYYSNPYLPHYMQVDTSTDYMEISPDDNDEIMGIPIQLGVMVCIKKNSIRKLHVTSPVSGADPNTWYADDPIAWIGSPAMWSITQTPQGVVFLGWDHWYNFDGAGALPIFDEFDTGDILPANYSDVVGFYHNGNFLAAYTDKISASQNHDRIMRYNYKRQALSVDLWTSSTIFGANCFAARTGDDEVGDLYYGDSVNGYVVKDKETESLYRLRTKTEANLGTKSTVFVGGTENSPYIEPGEITSAVKIPDDICIFWDQETSTPGSGWTEVTGYEDRLIKISTTALTTAAGTGHTHTLSGSIPSWTGTLRNGGDGSANAINGAHSHEVSYASDSSTPLPRHIKYRIFKKNSSTTEYEFPDGAIVMWDQSTPPDGWTALSEVGYYIVPGTSGLDTATSSTHTHTFSIPTGTAAGVLSDSDSGTNNPRFAHTHMITGSVSTETLDTWEVDYVSIGFIKKVGESDTWDGVDKYVYALYASSGTPDASWTDVSSTYEDKFLKIGNGTPATGSAANQSHNHTAGTFTTSTESAKWGNDGYHTQQYTSPHTHSVILSSTTATLGTPASVTFRIFKKILGKMKDYNTAITTQYTSGTWTSPSAEINAETLLKIYWNEDVDTGDSVLFYTRTGATKSACEAASWSSALTDPNGSDIASTANVWIQYKIEFTAVDSRVTNPRVYFTNGYAVKISYQGGSTVAESSVNYIYSIGFRNFDEPMLDKIFKKIATVHEGSYGSFTVNWETENSSGTFTVPLTTYGARWESYFPDDAMGREIDIDIRKNDLYSLRLSEVEGLYSPMVVVI